MTDRRELLRAACFKAMILTAKHHDGFYLWPSRTTSHGVASSPWRGRHDELVEGRSSHRHGAVPGGPGDHALTAGR